MTMSDAELERATLPVLLASWARIVDVVARGDMSPDEFQRDVRVRHEIAKRIRSRPATAETRELLAELDGWMREATEPTSACALGAEQAEREGWTPSLQWYYWIGLRNA
ncbi:MAG: hypothetical protein IBJ03_03000 [Gemmatimonadaceae bacterium]|nr:hypothetical protein [Gemmatimonadaceae bacterium]